MFGGEWEIHGQLNQRISDTAEMIQLSPESCNLLGYNNLIWVGGGHIPASQSATFYWAIYQMDTAELIFEGNMLSARMSFSVVEISDNRLLIMSGYNPDYGEIADCEILNLPALIETSLTLSIPTDDANPSSGSSAIVLNNNNILYGGGGQSDGYKWQIFDINTEIWGTIFYSIIGRHDFQLQLDPLSDNVIAMAGNPTYGEIEIFNPNTGQWALGPAIPQPVYAARTEVVSDSQIVLTGGYAWTEFFNQTVLYNTITNTITELNAFPLGRCNHGAVWIEPLQSLFIGGGYTSSSATKTCYSFHLPILSWVTENNLNIYNSWMNFFLTNDYHIFGIGNNYGRNLELYTWNYAPYLIDYSYATTTIPPTADINVEVYDSNVDSVAVQFIFVEDNDTTYTGWTEFRPSGYLFSIEHEWGSATSSHEVICEMKDINAPWNVHNSFADSLLTVNVSVDPHAPETILMQITPHPVKDNAVIHFTIQKSSHVQIDLYNLKGQLIQNVFQNPCFPGNYEIDFNTEHLAGGMYFLKFQTETKKFIKKMVLIK